MDKLGMEEDEPIEHSLITRSIEHAQKKVEARNFDMRKNVLEYDDVMNQQREVIYAQRRKVLMGEDLRDNIMYMIHEIIKAEMNQYASEKLYPEEWTLDGLVADAEGNDKVHFLITNTNPTSEMADYKSLAKVETVLPNFKQTGALAGVVAGLMTKTNSIGFIGGMKLPSTEAKYAAYLAAAQKINPEIKGQYNFEAGFTDASLGTKLTENWISTNNVDVMWGDASAVDNGSRQALESAGADTHFDIAQPIDIAGADQPTVVTSTVTDWKIDQAMDEIEKGEFGSGKTISADMSNGGISLGKFSDKVPEDVQAKIKELAEQIKSDSFVTDAEVEAIASTL